MDRTSLNIRSYIASRVRDYFGLAQNWGQHLADTEQYAKEAGELDFFYEYCTIKGLNYKFIIRRHKINLILNAEEL